MKHYQAWRKYGDPTVVKQKQYHGKTLRERFFLYACVREGCWPWAGSTDRDGRGKLNVGGVPQLAARIAYKLHYGDIPEGKVVCHKCDNTKCVNPEHLFLGTQADNVRDMHEKGRARKRAVSGTAHHNAKLDADAVCVIRRSDASASQLAEQFGVSRAVIYDVRNGKIWKHVEDEEHA
jgi:hypothetical protein